MSNPGIEERFQSLFEHSPICLWEEDGTELRMYLDQLRADGVVDMRGYFRDHPDAVGRCMGMIKVLAVNQTSVLAYEARDKAELIAGLARTLTPGSYAVLAEQLVRLAEGETVFEAETTAQTFTGRTIDIMLKTIVPPGYEHTLSRVYVAIVDITARKQAQHELRALALFPELNPHAVLQLAADGTIAYANPASDALASTLGASLVDLLPATTPVIVRDALASGRTLPHLETLHGARTLAWSFHPVVALAIVHCYAVDITERLQLEEQLRQSQKMDAIGRLAGGIAHDFNNLLTVIHGNTVLLQRGKGSGSLDSIAKATDRAAALVAQLLAFGRRQMLQTLEVELNATVANLMAILARVVREDVEVRLELAPDPVWIHADPGMLDQVLMNLVVNARDAMPDGGALALATSVVAIEADSGLELAPGDYACVRVRDTGVGIPPEHLARIFDPFFTTKQLGRGTGLGLSTVFGIVKQHGGALAVTSEVGRGTTFSMFLPSVADAATTRGTSDVAIEPSGGTETILVVEDEESVRELVRKVLEMYGYRVEVAATGAAALALIEGGARFDLVLTDLIMPGGISGREVAARLTPAQKVLYMSGYAGELAGRGVELRDGVNFLKKPFGPTPLLVGVRRCLDGS